MATPVLIDLTNYDDYLVESSQSREFSPDGNIFFDVANGRIEIITAEELANVDLGSGAEANPLTNTLGIKMEALYAFERKVRRTNETLRQYDPYFEGTFKAAGAYELVNGRKFDDADGTDTSTTLNSAGETDDRVKIRGSGWNERDENGNISRIYYGVVTLGTGIQANSQAYYQLSANGAPTDFALAGPVNEAIQVFGNSSVDVNTTTFDSRTYLSNKIRTFGYNYDEKLLSDSGVAESGPFSTGFALDEDPHLTTGNYDLADVIGGARVSPWTGMSLEKKAVAQVESGFIEANGSFSWVLSNDNNGTLAQCVAFLEALAIQDTDIDAGSETVTYGKRVSTWYTYSASGKIITRSGAGDGLGLAIENIPASDRQSVIFTDDSGNTKNYPFIVEINVTVGDNAVADANAWYHAFFSTGPGGNNFNTANAITVRDSSNNEVKGNVANDASNSVITFDFDFVGDTVGGTANTEKDVVFQCEGDGGVKATVTVFTITTQSPISVTCIPAVETNV